MSARSDGEILYMLGLMLQRDEGAARPRPVTSVGVHFPHSTKITTTTHTTYATTSTEGLQREQELDLGDFRVWVDAAKRRGAK